MDLTIADIEQTLTEQLAPLEQQAQQLKEELAAVEEQSTRIRAALKALGGGKRKVVRSRKPCATQQDVRTILTGLLSDNGSLSEMELEELAKEKLREDGGKSLSGFSLRFQETLTDPQFQRTSDGRITLGHTHPDEDR